MSVQLSIQAMACRFEIVLEGDDPVRLRSAGEEAIAEIEALDRQLSRFRPESDVSWVNAHAAEAPVKVEPRLFRLLQRAKEIFEATGGAFDITIASLMRVWGFTSGDGQVPSSELIDEALAAVGFEHVVLDDGDFTVRFDRPGVEIDLGAIGKGYAVERAVECLTEAGVTSALVHGGTSTVYGLGGPTTPGVGSWELGVGERGYKVQLRDSALSVSAVHGRSFVDEGREYGHVIDPRLGQPVSHTRLAAVWGPSPTDCDALSTALLVLGENWLPQMAVRFPGYEGRVVRAEA